MVNNNYEKHPLTLYLNANEEKALIDFLSNYKESTENPAEKTSTGFERVEEGEEYYGYEVFPWFAGDDPDYDDEQYAKGDYFSNRTVAENVTRAIHLSMKLVRFAAEHDASVKAKDKIWEITYVIEKHDLEAMMNGQALQSFGVPFSSAYFARMAIEEFREELLWYFTEFLPSLNDRY